jgi:two-component system OmpR family sensor kinase
MKVPLPRSLRFRLVFKQTLSFALLVTLLAWGAYAFLARRMSNQFEGELQDRSIAVRSMLNIRDGQVRWLNKEADPEVRDEFERSIRFYQVLDDHGKPLESAREWPAQDLPASAKARETIATARTTWEDISDANGRLRVLNAPVSGPRHQTYVLRVGMSMAGVDEDTFYLRLMHSIVLAFLVLVHAINAWLIAGKELHPLEQLASAAEEIAPHDRDKRLPTFGTGDELDELSRVLNQTLSKLQGSLQRMTDFLRSLSHEIRQPLTVMRAETEQALRMSQSDENYREMLSGQLQRIELLSHTVSDLLEMATADEEVKLHRGPDDLSELVQAAVDGMRLKPNELDVQISGSIQQGVSGNFDAGQLWRLLLNLLENAIKFNRPHGKVDVSLSTHDGWAILSVSDTGCGIPVEEQSRIFERGYRSNRARSSLVPGTGLGLHFVRSIAHAHGGEVQVTSMPGEGTCFRVSLPLNAITESHDPPRLATHDTSVH